MATVTDGLHVFDTCSHMVHGFTYTEGTENDLAWCVSGPRAYLLY